MELAKLVQGIEYSGKLPQGTATLVTQDSRKAAPGAVFVCIEGRGFDGHNFAQNALEKGAALIVSGRPLGLQKEITVKDPRKAYARLCANFFENPAEKLILVGVTGTNGKTTVTSVLKQTLEGLGVKCGLIGTIQNEIDELVVPAKFTTPEAWDLNALFAQMVKASVTHVIMEASSQALAQGRLSGLHFALAVFTNLTQDHLDYHGTMEEYFAAKKLLFAQSGAMLVNCDDEWGRRLLAEADCPVKKSYSAQSDAADFTAKNIDLRAGGVRFGFLGDGFLCPVQFAMPGAYSAANALAAAASAVMLGFAPNDAASALAKVIGVKGRCEVIYSGGFTVIRDFAHTADGLDKLLEGLKPFVTGRLVALFGCAGQRDAGKRPAMGKAAGRWATEVIITADNPRMEDVEKTINDAVPGVRETGTPYITRTNREEAIYEALEGMKNGDMLVLCGKGHEDYQVLNGVTIYFDERALVKGWLAEHGM